MSIDIWLSELARDANEKPDGQSLKKPFGFTVACNCGYDHEGRPEEGSGNGCGAFGRLEFGTEPPQPGESKQVSVRAAERPAAPAALEWERRIREHGFGYLASIRGSAEKWGASIGTLLGLFAVVALVKGPSDISEVEGTLWGWGHRTWTITWVIVALAAAVFATAAAAYAAQGTPKKIRFVGERLRKAERQGAKHAAWAMLGSRICALLAVAALATSVVWVWLTTPDKPEPTVGVRVNLVGADDRFVCGTLVASSQDGSVVLVPTGAKEPLQVPVEQIRSIGPDDSCGG